MHMRRLAPIGHVTLWDELARPAPRPVPEPAPVAGVSSCR